jgi:hypothetical protein
MNIQGLPARSVEDHRHQVLKVTLTLNQNIMRSLSAERRALTSTKYICAVTVVAGNLAALGSEFRCPA